MKKISTILVTGSHGYIGKLLVSKLQLKTYRVFEYDIKNGPHQNTLDLAILKKYLQDHQIDCVYHLVAMRNIDSCQNNKLAKYINFNNAVDVAQICHDMNVRFIFTSTCAVHDVQNDYSSAKLLAEENMPSSATIMRLSNVIGAYPGYTCHEYPCLTENIIMAMNGDLKALNLYGDCSRNYVFIGNVVHDLIKLLDRETSTYLCTGKLSVSTHEWVESVLEYFNAEVPVISHVKKPHDAQSLIKDYVFCGDSFTQIMESYRDLIKTKRDCIAV